MGHSNKRFSCSITCRFSRPRIALLLLRHFLQHHCLVVSIYQNTLDRSSKKRSRSVRVGDSALQTISRRLLRLIPYRNLVSSRANPNDRTCEMHKLTVVRSTRLSLTANDVVDQCSVSPGDIMRPSLSIGCHPGSRNNERERAVEPRQYSLPQIGAMIFRDPIKSIALTLTTALTLIYQVRACHHSITSFAPHRETFRLCLTAAHDRCVTILCKLINLCEST